MPTPLSTDDLALSVADQAYKAAGSPELPPDPVPQRMGSGDHLNPQQFADQTEEVPTRPGETPAVHANPLGWYGLPSTQATGPAQGLQTAVDPAEANGDAQ